MDPFTCAPLKAFPELLRLDGVAPIRENAKLGAKIEVCFSQLNATGLDAPYSDSSLHGAVRSVTVSTRWLHVLTVGSVWQNGKRLFTPNIFNTPFLIDAGKARTVSLKESFKLNKAWINTAVPIKGISSGANAIQLFSSLYVIVPVINDPRTQWLVVPSSELLRFYTAASSRLIPKSLKGSLGDYVDWSKSSLDAEKVILYARENLSLVERAVLARAVADPTAKAALLKPHQNLARIKANNAVLPDNRRGPLTVKAEFPFNDMSQLIVAGVRVQLDENDSQSHAVFAMEIAQCNHSLGFSDIEFHSACASAGQGPIKPNSGDNHRPRFNASEEDDEEDDELLDSPADPRLPRQVARIFTNPFPDLQNVNFTTVRPRVNDDTNQPGPMIQIDVDGRTMAEGNGDEENKNTVGVNSSLQLTGGTDRDLLLFLEMLQHLREIIAPRGWKITTRKLSNFILHNTDAITFFPERIAKKHSWHKIVDPDGQTRTRQVIWAEVTNGNKSKYFYLLEMESKTDDKHCTLLLHNNDFSLLTNKDFNLLLKLTAIRNRWLHGKNTWKTERIRRVADKLLSQIKLHAIDHPRSKKSEIDSQHNSTLLTPSRIDTILWSVLLQGRIDRYFSSLRKL